MRIFLTGGTGFIGSHVINAAHHAGHDVVALRRSGSKPPIPLARQPEWVDGTLEDFTESALCSCDVLLHLAAHGVNPAHANWQDCFRWNVTASINLWLKAADFGIRRFVIAGSCFEYGRSGERLEFIPTSAPLLPTGPYHASKAAATMAASAFAADRGVEVAVLRPFHVYGPGEAPERFWPSLHAAAVSGSDFPMTAGTQVRDFVPVSGVANAFAKAVTRIDLSPGVLTLENLGSGTPLSLLEFAQSQWRSLEAKGSLIPGALPMRDHEVMRYVPDLLS